MAKLKSPLLSFSAHGTLGDVLVFFDRHGKNYVRSKPQDPVSLSIAQGLLRDCFVSAAISAHSLTQGQKDSYAAAAPNSAFCPWWNNFIGQYIEDNYEGPDVATTFLKSVQIATGIIADGDSYIDITVNEFTPDKSVPFMLGAEASLDDPRNHEIYCSFIGTTTVRVSRHTSPKVGALNVSVFVLEFEPAFIVGHQNRQVNFGAGDVLATIAIDERNLAKTVLFPRGNVCTADVAPTVYKAYSDFLNNTTIRARRNTSGVAVYYMYTVVEFI
jgi:hypothetical protein